MPNIVFMPMNKKCEAQEGESILDVALNNYIPIQHACGGFCSCTTCHVKVIEHPQGLMEMDQDEEETLARVDGWSAQSRLGCQAKVKGDVTVEIMNLDE